jgi:hypothetical protein
MAPRSVEYHSFYKICASLHPRSAVATKRSHTDGKIDFYAPYFEPNSTMPYIGDAKYPLKQTEPVRFEGLEKKSGRGCYELILGS